MSGSTVGGAPNPIAEQMGKFQTRKLTQRAPVTTIESVLSRPSSRPVSRPAASLQRFGIPPLSTLALEALVRGFEAKPTLTGIPPEFAGAVAARLPVDLDPRLTVPAVHDENYWRRVCEEGWGWTRGRIRLEDHGCSWKQAFCELYVQHLLETFGVYPDLPLGYEEEFARPPMDSTHKRWPDVYPTAQRLRLDGKPNRERFAASAGEENETDSRILSAPDCGWPLLEKLKAIAKASIAATETNGGQAWAGVDKKAHLDANAAAEKAYQDAKEKEKQGASASQPPPGPEAAAAGGDAEAGAGGPVVALPQSLLAIPYSVVAEKAEREELMSAQRKEDAFDCAIEGVALREFVSPGDLAEWRSSTRWPTAEKRGDSIITARAKELQTLLDRITVCVDHVFRLQVRELPSHLDLELITSRLPNLTSLEVSYAPRHTGAKYDLATATMRVHDAENLVRCLKTTDVLTTLSLPANGIDDATLAVLMQGLLANKTIVTLDLSHNKLTDVGAGLLAKMLHAGSGGCVISSLKLSDNRIGQKGAEALAAVLRRSRAITRLDLRLNQVGDVGAAAILDSVAGNTTLESVNLSSNGLGKAAGAALSRALSASGCALRTVDVSNNKLGEAEAQAVLAALTTVNGGNKTVFVLDMRNNAGISATTSEGIMGALHSNELRARGGAAWPLTGVYEQAFLASGQSSPAAAAAAAASAAGGSSAGGR